MGMGPVCGGGSIYHGWHRKKGPDRLETFFACDSLIFTLGNRKYFDSLMQST